MAQRLLAIATGMIGEVAGGTALAEAGLAEARALGLRPVEPFFLNALAVLAEVRGDLVAGREYAQQELALHIELGARRNEMIARGNLAESEGQFGRFASARREAGATLAAARAMGDRVFEGTALGILADVALYQGEETQALAHAQAARAIAAETRGREREIDALLYLAGAELALGRTADAARSFGRMAELAREVGRFLPDALAGLARVALAEGDPAAAAAHLEAVLAALATGGTAEGEYERARIRLVCWQTLAAAGDPRAPRFLELAHHEVQSTADRISDPALKESFLANHPTHRAIVAAWAERG
jgi:tetratricopeptide (TPR) repeat protein